MLSGEALSVGMTITVLASAFSRTSKLPVSDATCTFTFYAPPKDPEHNPSDRTADHTVAGTFDANQNVYTADVDTTGWVPGKWTYRGTLLNANTGWSYDTFILLA